MTLSTTTVRTTYEGSGTTGPFSYPFKIFAASDLVVVRISSLNAFTTLTYATDYTVSGVGNASGGSVTLTDALETGERLSIFRAVPSTQPTSLRTLGTFRPEAHEDALDRLTMIAQQQIDTGARAIRIGSALDPSDFSLSVTPDTGKALVWGPDGITNATLDSSAIALPGDARQVDTVTAFLANNAVLNVRDYRLGTDGTPWHNAFQRALNAATSAASATIVIPTGEYRLDEMVTGVSNVVLEFEPGVRIYGLERRRAYFLFENKSNISIKGGRIDLGQSVLDTFAESDMSDPDVQTAGIEFNGCSDITIDDLTTRDLYTWALFFYNCSGRVSICRPWFYSPAQDQGSRAEHIAIQTCTADFDIVNPRFVNDRPSSSGKGVAALFASGTTGNVTVSGARGWYCGRDASVAAHQLGALAFYGDHKKVRILHSDFYDTLERAFRLTAVENFKVIGNNCYMSDLAAAGTDALISCEGSVASVPTGVGGVSHGKIHSNHLEDLHGTGHRGIFIGAYDYGYPSTDIDIGTNTHVGMSRSVSIQGPFRDVRVGPQHIMGKNGGAIEVLQQVTGAGITTTYGAEADAVYTDFKCQGTRFALDPTTPASDSALVSIDLRKSPAFSGTVGDFVVEDVRGRKTAAASAAQFVLRGVASKGRFFFRKCGLDAEHNYMFDVGIAGTVVIEDNDGAGFATAPVLNSGSVDTLEQRGNRWNGGALRGTVTLVAGTAEATAPEIRSGDIVHLSRQATGGTTGDLSVGTITAGTKFVINSSSSSDTSVVAWEIVH